MRPAVRIFIAENGMMVEFLEGDKYIASENETDLTKMVGQIAEYLEGSFSHVYHEKRLEVKAVPRTDWQEQT
jgi:hypothetical protein